MPRLTFRRLAIVSVAAALICLPALVAAVLAGALTATSAAVLALAGATLAALGVLGLGIRRLDSRVQRAFGDRVKIQALEQRTHVLTRRYTESLNDVAILAQDMRGSLGEHRLELLGALAQTGQHIDGLATAVERMDLSLAVQHRRPPWRRPTWSEQFQSGHGWSAIGKGVASSNANNSEAFVRGTQCFSFVTSGNREDASVSKLAGEVPDLVGKAFRIILRCTNAAKISSVNFFVGSRGLDNHFKWRLNPRTTGSILITEGQWVSITFGWGDLNRAAGSYTIVNGSPDTKTDFTDLQFQIIDDGTGAVTCDLQAVEIVDDASATFPNGLVSITFDDSHHSVYEYARPKMDALGYVGTQYTIVESLGKPGKLTTKELTALQDLSGWEIGIHAYNGSAHKLRYTALTAEEVNVDFRSARAWAMRNGFRGDSLAYPHGRFEETTDEIWVDSIAARYFTSARTILSESGYAGETFPAAMPYRLRSMSGISGTRSDANNPTKMVSPGGMLDKVANEGGWLIACFHKITTEIATTATECSQSDFNTIMDGIASRGMTVLAVGDVMAYRN